MIFSILLRKNICRCKDAGSCDGSLAEPLVLNLKYRTKIQNFLFPIHQLYGKEFFLQIFQHLPDSYLISNFASSSLMYSRLLPILQNHLS